MKMIVNHWKHLTYLSYGLVVIMNILMIVTFEVTGQDQVDMNAKRSVEMKSGILPVSEILLVIQIFQIILASLFWLGYVIEYGPVLIIKHAKLNTTSFLKLIPNFKGTLIFDYGREHEEEVQAQKLEQKTLCEHIWSYHLILYDFQYWANSLYWIFSLCGIFSHVLFYSILLLDIISKLELLREILGVIGKHAFSLFQTFVLMMIIIYLYSVVAFTQFPNQYIHNDGENEPDLNNYCNELYLCLTTTLNNGIRAGGGIGEMIYQPTTADDVYWMRYFFDLTFFILLILLMLNLVFGIILDAFSDMRNKKDDLNEECQSKCFICGLNRFEFDTRGEGWEKHIGSEHNTYSYIYYTMHLIEKELSECTEIEKHCKELMADKDVSFFPISQSMVLNQFTQNDEENLDYKLNQLSNNLAQYQDTVKEIMDSLKEKDETYP